MSNYNSLVLELQRDVLDSSISVLDIMRKASLVAKKLKIKEFEDWIDSELKGYSDEKPVPNYRIVRGRLIYWNQFHGWQPIILMDLCPDLEDRLYTRHIRESLNNFIEISKDDNVVFNLEFPSSVKKTIMDWAKKEINPVLQISKGSLTGIIESVKHTVLDWTYQLEKDGILGEEMAFSAQEKQIISGHNYKVIINNNMNQSQQGDIKMSESYQSKYDQRNANNQFVDTAQSGSNVTFNQTNYTPEQKQSLAEAAAEIQNLLKQLDETNPTATESEQIAHLKDNTTPNFRKRALSALQGGTEAAIDEFLLENKLLKVGKAVIKGYLQPDS